MAFDIEAAKAAGYTDAEISAYLQAKPKTETIAPVAPGEQVDPGEPPPPPPAENYKQAGEGNYMPGLATAGIGAAAVGVPAAIGLGLKYGLSGAASKASGVMDVARQGVSALQQGAGALQQQAQTGAQTEARLQNRPGFGGPSTAPQTAPPPRYNVPLAQTPNLPPPQANPLGEMGGVRPGATPPVGGPAAQQGANFIQRISQQFAPMAERVAPVLQKMAPIVNNPVTRFATGPVGQFVQGATYSPSLGPQVPSSGPARGMEINPSTGRAWTAQELDAYKKQYK